MYYVYMLSNSGNNVLYTGFTSDLKKRIYFHKNGLIPGFTKKYNVHKLIYFESFLDKNLALKRERQIKSYSRSKKNKLIELENSNWSDLVLLRT